MAAMLTRRGALPVSVLLSAVLAVPAFAGGTFKGTYGGQKFKARKASVGCSYFRSSGTFSLIGGQGGRKKQQGGGAAGSGADPTAPGATFPIVLTAPVATFFRGIGASPENQWSGFGDQLGGDVVVTLTGYKKGKISGTVSGTLQPYVGTSGPIQVNATFAAKCSIL